MGKASRRKWVDRARDYERLVIKGGQKVSQVYLDRFAGKPEKLLKGTEKLAEERKSNETLPDLP